MRSRPLIAMATAAAVVGATLLVAAPASANSASFTNPSTESDSSDFHVSTIDVDYSSATATVTFHLRNFAGLDAHAQIFFADGQFTETTGNVLAVRGDSASDADDAQEVQSTSGIDGFASGDETDAPDDSISSSVSAQTITITVPTSHIFWGGPLYVGGFLDDESNGSSAVAFQVFDDVSATGFGPVVKSAVPTTTTATLSSPTQLFGSTPAAVLATVSPASAGVVSLVEGATVVAAAVLTNGSALLTVPSTLPVGPHNLAVRFSPVDPTQFAPSTSATFGLTVTAAATTPVVTPAKSTKTTKTTVKLSKKSQTYKKAAAKVTVTVAGKPAGKVAIYDGKKKLKTVTLKEGKATYTLSKSLKKGTHKIKAVYTPTDKAAFTTSTSKVVNLNVKK